MVFLLSFSPILVFVATEGKTTGLSSTFRLEPEIPDRNYQLTFTYSR